MRPGASRWWCAALVVLATTGAAPAEEPLTLPDDTLPAPNGYPPLVPDVEDVRGDEQRAAWAERTLAWASSTTDPGLKADLLLSAAEVLRGLPDLHQRCYEVLQQGMALRPPSDPFGALARLSLLDLDLAAALPADARRQALTCWSYLSQPAPLDPTPQEAQRDALARQRISARFPPLVMRHALADGDLLMARDWARQMALHPDPSWHESDAERWERVAVLSHRVGRKGSARAFNDRARALATEPETQARLAFWRLYLEHDMLSPEGLITQTDRKPGPTFLQDLEAVLRGLAGNPYVGEFLLAAGSSALHTEAFELALAIYQRALTDRDFVARAQRRPALWGGLLPAVTAARALQRFDEAEALLSAIERIAGEPVPEADGLRTQVALARKALAEGRPVPPPPRPPAPPAPAADAPAPAPRAPRGTGRLELPTPPMGVEEGAPADEAEPPEDGAPGEGLLLWGALALLALLALVWALRRR